MQMRALRISIGGDMLMCSAGCVLVLQGALYKNISKAGGYLTIFWRTEQLRYC